MFDFYMKKKTPSNNLVNEVFNSKGVLMKKFNQKYSDKVVVMMGMLQKHKLEVNLKNLRKIATLFSKYYRCVLPSSESNCKVMSQEELQLIASFDSLVKKQQYDNVKKFLGGSAQLIIYVGYIVVSYVRKILDSDKSKLFKTSLIIGLILLLLFIFAYTLYFKVFGVNYLAEEYRENATILTLLNEIKESDFDLSYYTYNSINKLSLYFELLNKLFEKYPQLIEMNNVVNDVVEEKIDITISPKTESDNEEQFSPQQSPQEKVEIIQEQENIETNPETNQEPEQQPVNGETKQEQQPINGEINQEPEQQPVNGETYPEPEQQPVNGETNQEPEQQPVNGETNQEPEQQPVNGETNQEPEQQPVNGETNQKQVNNEINNKQKKEFKYKKVNNKKYNKKPKTSED